MRNFCSDLKHAVRQLFRNPGFTGVAVAALALGIGANTSIFTVVNTVLLRPLAYPNADRIVEFGFRSMTLANFLSNIPEFHEYQRQSRVFQEVAAYDSAGPGFNLTGDHPEQIHGIHVTEGYFRLFGAPVMLGRTFTPREDSPNGGRVAVLSYGLWQRRFGGDPGIVGRSISLGSEPYTVVGIIGKGFVAEPKADLWLPFQFPPDSNNMNSSFQVAGLLRPGVTLAMARAQLKVAALEFRRLYPQTNAHAEFQIQPLLESVVGDSRRSLLVMLGAMSLVLLIACSNVANLLLARAITRRREFAIRGALGAGCSRIVRQLLTESLLLSTIGGVVGMAIGFAGVRTLLALNPAGLPRLGENGSALGLDWRVLLFTLAISLGTGIVFGLFPAFAAARTDLQTALKESSRSSSGVRQGRTRSLLAVSQISLSLALLVGSVLLIRTFIALHSVEPGFDARNVLTLEMSLTGDRFQNTAGVARLLRDGRNRLNAIPGVETSAAAYWLPIQVEDGLPFQIVGRPVDKDHQYASRWMSISPGYLDVFRVPVLQGRDFNENDTARSPAVALVNEAFARQYWPKQNPVGHQIAVSKGLGADLNESSPIVVGVVGDSHNAGLGRPADPMIIVPIAQVTDNYTAAYSNVQPLLWVVRTQSNPASLLSAVTEQLRQASGGLPAAHARTMEEVMRSSTARQSFNMLLLSIFGAAALMLAAIGTYGLMAYSVAQRQQEMGIRMALGADRSAIRGLVIRAGMKLTVAGVVAGLLLASALTRLMSGFLFRVSPWDPVAFVAAPLLLTLVTLLAMWLPGARASRVDPAQALRSE